MARQYFLGGAPPIAAIGEDDPVFTADYTLIMHDLSTHTGVPISSISEIENHVSYTLGLDTVCSLVAFLYLNSKNGHLVEPWVELAKEAIAVLSVNESIRTINQQSGYRPVTDVLEASPTEEVAHSGTIAENIPSREFVAAIDFLLNEWGRLTDSSPQVAAKAAKLPVDELEKFRLKLQEQEADTGGSKKKPRPAHGRNRASREHIRSLLQ
jgi:hypothetical protein